MKERYCVGCRRRHQGKFTAFPRSAEALTKWASHFPTEKNINQNSNICEKWIPHDFSRPNPIFLASTLDGRSYDIDEEGNRAKRRCVRAQQVLFSEGLKMKKERDRLTEELSKVETRNVVIEQEQIDLKAKLLVLEQEEKEARERAAAIRSNLGMPQAVRSDDANTDTSPCLITPASRNFFEFKDLGARDSNAKKRKNKLLPNFVTFETYDDWKKYTEEVVQEMERQHIEWKKEITIETAIGMAMTHLRLAMKYKTIAGIGSVSETTVRGAVATVLPAMAAVGRKSFGVKIAADEPVQSQGHTQFLEKAVNSLSPIFAHQSL